MTMTLDEFVKAYDGTIVPSNTYKDDAGRPVTSRRGQCVALVRAYIDRVWGVPQPSGRAAALDWAVNLPEFMEFYKNEPTTIPFDGELVVFDSSYGEFGHIAIVYTATLMTMVVFEEDGIKMTPAQKKDRSYGGVLGFIRLKGVDGVQTGGQAV
jgi:hypothetical protein